MNSPKSPCRTPHTRNYFYVGGLERLLVGAGASEIVHGQVYVEHLAPVQVTCSTPIVFIHGNWMTGTAWLNTPDGRPGWADYFLARGYEVEAPDMCAARRVLSYFTRSTLSINLAAVDHHGTKA